MERNKIVKKAWGIDWDKINEGAYYSGNIDVVYADSRGKAKSLLLPDIREYELRYSDDKIEFINLPILRIKEADKFDFDGEILTIWQYEEKKTEVERLAKLDSIQENEKITHCYISKGSYYCDNWCGYTDYRSKAGVYDKIEAVNHAKSCIDVSAIPINEEEHNKLINAEIEKLQKRLIN